MTCSVSPPRNEMKNAEQLIKAQLKVLKKAEWRALFAPPRETMSPLTARCPLSLYKAIKEHCENHGLQMQKFIRQALEEKLGGKKNGK